MCVEHGGVWHRFLCLTHMFLCWHVLVLTCFVTDMFCCNFSAVLRIRAGLTARTALPEVFGWFVFVLCLYGTDFCFDFENLCVILFLDCTKFNNMYFVLAGTRTRTTARSGANSVTRLLPYLLSYLFRLFSACFGRIWHMSLRFRLNMFASPFMGVFLFRFFQISLLKVVTFRSGFHMLSVCSNMFVSLVNLSFSFV